MLSDVPAAEERISPDENEATATTPKMRKSLSAWTFSFSSGR